MARLSKEETARYGGANWLLEYAEREGLSEARKEMERRGALGIPVGVKKADIDRFVVNEKRNTIATVLLMAAATLRDEFGFGRDRLDRFIRRFNSKTECLVDDFVSWKDLQQTILDETGILVPIPEEFMEEVR